MLLAEAFSLGYLRFLDFQKVDEAQRKLIDELEEELQTAHDMQMGLMPAEPPLIEGFDIVDVCVTDITIYYETQELRDSQENQSVACATLEFELDGELYQTRTCLTEEALHSNLGASSGR